jgi:ferrochelatase
MVATPEKPQDQISEQNQETDRVAVLLIGYGEVESYKNFANYNNQALHLLTAKFAPIPEWVYPLFAQYLALSDWYEWKFENHNFRSPHNKIFEKQRAGIEKELQEKWGNSKVTSNEPRVRVFKAFNFCKPFLPEQVLSEIKEQGFDKVLIYPLLVVDSIFTSGIAVEQVNKGIKQLTQNEEHWLQDTRYIPSFYDRSSYIDLVASLVEEKIATELEADHLPSQTGIVLMNHGCPEEAKGFVTGIKESQALYDQVRDQLIDRYPLISVGWLNHDTPFVKWTQPNADRAAENLIQLGASAVVFMPMGFATENHETILDVDTIIERVRRKHSDVTYLRMNAVNDHPDFLKMAAQWANPKVAALLSKTAAFSQA